MKKIFALALALVLSFALAIPCFAASVPTSQSGDVKASYQPASAPATVYSVDVEFGAMTFTYQDANEGTWNPNTHGYTNAAEPSWTCADGANAVTVTNHSNAAVAVTVSYHKGASFQGITGNVTNGSFTLESAVGKAVAAADSKTATLALSGALASGTAANTVIGTLTVAFSAG